MIDFIKNFHADEDGAVTVDWVVLTAAVVGLGIAGVASVRGGVDSLAGKINSGLSDAQYHRTFHDWAPTAAAAVRHRR